MKGENGMKIGFDTFSVIGEDLSYADRTSAKDHPEGYLTGFEAYGLTDKAIIEAVQRVLARK